MLTKYLIYAVATGFTLCSCPYAGAGKIVRRSLGWKPTYVNTMTASQWDVVRNEIDKLVKLGHGPFFVRLAWHDAGSYEASPPSGGPHAAMRFTGPGEEGTYGGNAGLQVKG
jgi:hypothetical protein